MLIKDKESAKIRELMEKEGFVCEAETEEIMHFSGPGAVDFLKAKRELSLRMINDASRVSEVKAKVALVEDIIGLKIQAYCNDSSRQWKDQADIAELIRCNPKMDWQRVMKYTKIFQQEQRLEEIRRSMKGI